MIKQVTTALALTLLVSACSTPIERRQISGSDKYLEAKESQRLVVPAPLKEPQYSSEFDIPPLSEEAKSTPKGKDLDIRPPLQVIASAEGTHVESGVDNVKVTIEAVGRKDLKEEVYKAISDYLEQNDVATVTSNIDSGIIETDWVENREEFRKRWIGSNDEYVLRQRYRFSIDVSPHGRTGSVTIDLVEHEESIDGVDEIPALTSEDKRRYTIDVLNDAVAFLSARRALDAKAEAIRNSLGISIDMIANADGDKVWIAEADYMRTWERLAVVLPELGFDIEDRDRNNGIYYARTGEGEGFWQSMFGAETMPLEDGLYRFKLSDTDDSKKTQIQLFDATDNKLDNETMDEIYQFFSDVMGEDRNSRR
ncbi:outer membrane protein assembly factor BamC [Paraferrimonas haliotis]|uniref:Outer membrane protein assembly factor BamC n=1 Tax=Paraferrimonas haliotis TaxID=2013866 RepID=A0AA37TMH7_9GAMM|nr:outer membrane protein assembly factor BamC [Paraferrimonas haliotis]GLS84284.1 outer membrane protein assembly factor BamC [Paraferrimonas haliotis]